MSAMCGCHRPTRKDALKAMVKPAQTMDELLVWYEECRTDIETCPEPQRKTLRRILDMRFHEEETRLRTMV